LVLGKYQFTETSMANLDDEFTWKIFDILKKIIFVLRRVLYSLSQQLFVSCGSQTFIAVSAEVH
jgi:hypothetical protein